jgi:hypothetical protein
MRRKDLNHGEESVKRLHFPNEIKEIRNLKHLEKVELDFESPRMKEALFNLGVSFDEC